MTEYKRHSYATDLIFQKVQENVGIIAADQTDVIEPFQPTNHFISYQSVEANRQEVKNNIVLTNGLYYLLSTYFTGL